MPDTVRTAVLHSRYDPVKEAIRYIDQQDFPFRPAIIVITEPGESYLAEPLRSRFPGAALVAVRYQDSSFKDTDCLWDAVWRPGSRTALVSFLFNCVPDELLPVTSFLCWKPSDAVWPEMSRTVWEGISSMIRTQQSVMYTRSAFGSRWFLNMVKNCAQAEHLCFAPKTAKPVILAAAGPSLEKLFPLNNSGYYICAVSAASSCLAAHGCLPDVSIATDGGYWAMDHFRNLPTTVPVAFPLEAAIPERVLEGNPLIVLSYGSCLENLFLDSSGIVAEKACRNGTVSGTAALYALSHTASCVLAAGLDLAPTSSFSHARPNVADSAIDISTDRMRPLAGALYDKNRNYGALETYAGWFESRDATFRGRFFRLSSQGRPLAGIRTVSLEEGPAPDYSRPESLRWQRALTCSARRDVLSEWIGNTKEDFANFQGGMKSSGAPIRFAEMLERRPELTEFLQMSSYTDYLNYLKACRADRNDDIAAIIRSMSEKASALLDKSLRKAASDGR